MTVAFRMGHTLVRNNFQQLPGDFTRFRLPLPERNSFLNNRPIFRDGIEPVCEVCSEIREMQKISTSLSQQASEELCLFLQDRVDSKPISVEYSPWYRSWFSKLLTMQKLMQGSK